VDNFPYFVEKNKDSGIFYRKPFRETSVFFVFHDVIYYNIKN